MTAIGGSNKQIVGTVIDFLFSAAVTVACARSALIGLSKVSCVASRGVNEALKQIGFNTEKAGSYAHTAAAWLPTRLVTFFRDDSGYNDKVTLTIQVQERNRDGSIKVVNGGPAMVTEQVEEYKRSAVTLLVSGLGLTLIALVGLELKEALWRPTNPIVNGVLTYISPFRLVLGQSWASKAIYHVVGAVRARV
ncbi:MAG TPA: hypothetical protein VMR37_08225 [Rhabdochlamydiaceae bacterium]|nr:hypothetical protein [Rhabdochlamydiaceae bacterium]